MLSIEKIAQVCHEANKAYCETLGDMSQLPWNAAPEWQTKSAIDGVIFHIKNPGATPGRSHDNWLKTKAAEGWSYGPVKDTQKKEHPCFVEYSDLPAEQKAKDALFIAVVGALKILLPK